jgi:hypothetical protein
VVVVVVLLVYMMSNSTEEIAKAPNNAILCLLLSCENCDLHRPAAAAAADASCDILKPIDGDKEMLQSETDVSRTPNCRSQRSTSPFITVLTRRSAIGTKKKKKMEQAFVWPWKSHKWATFLAISMFAFLLRMLVSLHSYSGICSYPICPFLSSVVTEKNIEEAFLC